MHQVTDAAQRFGAGAQHVAGRLRSGAGGSGFRAVGPAAGPTPWTYPAADPADAHAVTTAAHEGPAAAGDPLCGPAASARTRGLRRARGRRAVRELRAGCVRGDDRVPVAGGMPPGGAGAPGCGKDTSPRSFDENTRAGQVARGAGATARKDRSRTVFGDHRP